MFDRKKAKSLAKARLSVHYWIFAAACFLATFFGVEYTFSMESLNGWLDNTPSYITQIREGRMPIEAIAPFHHSAFDVFGEIVNGNAEKGQKLSDEILKNNEDTTDMIFEKIELGYKDGVFATIANAVSSGSPFVTAYIGLKSTFGSDNIAMALFIIIAILIIFAVWALVVNTYRAVYRRIFLEGYIYSRVQIKTFIHFIRVRKYFKASLTMLVMIGLKILWALTIIGGVIKQFSYFLTPYIVAENPDISPMTAITLSKDMMYGHKMECFKLWLSFIGWYILELITLGISGMIYSNAYREATFTEYYVYLRTIAKEKGIKNAELLNDDYLYKKAKSDDLAAIYSDYGRSLDKPDKPLPGNRVWRFFANVFGIVPFYNEAEEEYFRYTLQKSKGAQYKKLINGQMYPGRLNPIPEKQKNSKLEYLNYRRLYSVWSLIMLFFMFAFIGWAWEVVFHLVSEGRFVNRGMLHGPIIPIYGSGGLMALVFLNKLRHKPVQCFIVSMAVCGVMEYITGALVEHFTGQRWWDYSGYFLNINGLVCAEGLLVFGIGCMITVYLAAPLTDNLLRKIRLRYLVLICTVLMLVFVSDIIYSKFVPNGGEGINDFKTACRCTVQTSEIQHLND